LKEALNGDSREATQNNFPPTEKQRSFPHFTSSVAAGNERQYLRRKSMFIAQCKIAYLRLNIERKPIIRMFH
jgi:hypothetical protein